MGACSVNIQRWLYQADRCLPVITKGKKLVQVISGVMLHRLKKEQCRKMNLLPSNQLYAAAMDIAPLWAQASTMASMVESLGLTLPGNAAIPAADARRKTFAQLSGLRIVEMVKRKFKA